jgi:hypothetical protein
VLSGDNPFASALLGCKYLLVLLRLSILGLRDCRGMRHGGKWKKEKEKGKELEKWKGSWVQKQTNTIEMVPDVQPLVGKSEDDCQMFCWDQKNNRQFMKMVKDGKDKELERLQAPLKWRPCTELWLPVGSTHSLPLHVSGEEIEFSKKLNLHVKTKHKIRIDRERGLERLHHDRTAKAEWPELSQRRIELNGWQMHMSEDPDARAE